MASTVRAALAAVLLLPAPLAFAGPSLSFNQLWSFYASDVLPDSQADVFDGSAAEIVAHDSASQRVFVVNGFAKRVDVLDAFSGAFLGTLDVSAFGSPNSVAASNGRIAVAVGAPNKTDNGSVVFFDANDGGLGSGGTSTGSVSVGPLPDMVTFTPDGSKVIVANEGEPTFYGQDGIDPDGSISIIDVGTLTETRADFSSFDKAGLVAAGVRITGPGTGAASEATAQQDLEPEYISVSADGSTAYVTLQENNAIAEVDIGSGTVTAIRALGTKDHAVPGNGLDASDRDGAGNDGAINIQTWPLRGMYMPDSIASYESGGNRYLVTANEGDGREYIIDDIAPGANGTDYTDEERVKDLPLGGIVTTSLKDDDNLGRLTVSSVGFDGSVPTTYDELFSFGSRSFSIWDAATGMQVFDSGDDFERITAAMGLLDQDGNPIFNSDNDGNDSFDSRSDAKGPEPEALVLGEIAGRMLAFIGLERIGGIMIYDITDPSNVAFMDYLLDRNFSVDADTKIAGDLGPEGLYFLTPDLSPTGRYGLLVANEVSGNTTYYDIHVPLPATLALLAIGLPLLGVGRRTLR